MTRTYRSNSLSIDEQERVYRVLDSYEDLALFKLALNSGIRREDITSIEVGNINFEHNTLTFWESKKKRFWTIPLIPDVANELKRYINTLPKGQRFLFNFSGRTAYNRLQKALEKAGINKELSFHDLRRSFMKTAKKKGVDIKAVSQITGDSLSTIQNFYENMDMEELQQELKKMQ